MAVAIEDLFEPRGPLDEDFWPDREPEAVHDSVGRYLAEAREKVASFQAINPTVRLASEDRVVRAWALHRAFNSIYLSMCRNPASASLADQGQKTHLDIQIRSFGEQARGYAQEYEEALSSARSLPSQGSPAGSGATRNRITY